MDEQWDDIDRMLARSLRGELTEAEKEQLAQWLEENPGRKAEFSELEAVWRATSFLEVPAGESFEKRWSKLSAVTNTKKARRRTFIYRIAASLLLVAVVGVFASLWVGSKIVSVKAGPGEIRNVALPDGSTITLNSGSRVEFNRALWFLGRTVSLEGEAFFNVTGDGSAFSVHAGTVTVSVLGTSFNIKNRTTVAVACFTGKVSVRHGAGQVQLTKGMQCKLQQEKLIVSSFDPGSSHVTAWMEGKLDFDRTPLSEVFETLEQFYGVHISVDLKKTQTFTGAFDKGTAPEAIISVVCLSTGLTWVREDSSRFKITE